MICVNNVDFSEHTLSMNSMYPLNRHSHKYSHEPVVCVWKREKGNKEIAFGAGTIQTKGRYWLCAQNAAWNKMSFFSRTIQFS